MSMCSNIENLNMLIIKKAANRNKELGYDITPVQALIIMCVFDNNKLCQKDIEQFVPCNKSTLSSVLDTMEKNGLIYRLEDKNDSRKKIISLTEKSISIAKVLTKDKNYLEDILLKDLTQDEIIQFNNIVAKMIKNLERI